MLGALVSILLLSSLLIAYISIRGQPMPENRPLNVDTGLPFPGFGQASTVFSLTAWFGAYFAIFLVLGIPAVLGIGIGTVLALYGVRLWVVASKAECFEDFITYLLHGEDEHYASWLSFIVSAMWLGFAASEVIIFKEVVQSVLSTRSDHAILMSVGASIIAYYYLLIGGYLALHRTDIVQFIFVMVMTTTLTGIVVLNGAVFTAPTKLWPRMGYWEFPLPNLASQWGTYIYHCLIGAVMGGGFILASPDTWKRVFIVEKKKVSGSHNFSLFVVVGLAPFIMLIPFVIGLPYVPDGPIQIGTLLSLFPASGILDAVLLLGLFSCFLSSFDSAVLSAVHIILLQSHRARGIKKGVTAFYILMGIALLITLMIAGWAMSFANNPYALANYLLGIFALVAGLLIGAGGRFKQLPQNTLIFTSTAALTVWTAYFLYVMREQNGPTTYQVNTTPFGVALTCIVAFVSRIAMRER